MKVWGSLDLAVNWLDPLLRAIVGRGKRGKPGPARAGDRPPSPIRKSLSQLRFRARPDRKGRGTQKNRSFRTEIHDG